MILQAIQHVHVENLSNTDAVLVAHLPLARKVTTKFTLTIPADIFEDRQYRTYGQTASWNYGLDLIYHIIGIAAAVCNDVP